MKFRFHNEAQIPFPPIRPTYEEGDLLFGRFRTLTPRDAKDSIIGEGGTGLIHLVRDELMDRIVALKLPNESILCDPGARLDVIRETRQAIELTHPNIVRIHDFHESSGKWGISMQYIRGKNLDEYRQESISGPRRSGSRRAITPYPVERVANWIVQLCNALIYAHEDAHMVHRDIKPTNLMLERRADEFEKLLLTDFGITQKLRHHNLMLSRVQPASDEKSAIGTLPYMSWEQIRGAPASTLDDIYSVGATIYDLLTGRPPFYNGTHEQIRVQVGDIVPPSMTERLRQFDLMYDPIPDTWEQTVAACLAKRPEDRPQTVREIMVRLDLTSAAAPVHAVESVPVVSSNEIQTLREDLHLREMQLQILRNELAISQSEIAALDAQLKDAVARASTFEKAIHEDRLALVEAKGLRAEGLELLARLQSELEEKGRQIAEASSQRKQLEGSLYALELQIQAAIQARSDLDTELATARKDAEASAEKITEIERSAASRIRDIEATASAQREAARQTALQATAVAEKAARHKTGRAIAEAIAIAEVAKLHAAELYEKVSKDGAAMRV